VPCSPPFQGGVPGQPRVVLRARIPVSDRGSRGLFDDDEARKQIVQLRPGRGAPEGDRGASFRDRRAARAAGFLRQNRVVDLATDRS